MPPAQAALRVTLGDMSRRFEAAAQRRGVALSSFETGHQAVDLHRLVPSPTRDLVLITGAWPTADRLVLPPSARVPFFSPLSKKPWVVWSRSSTSNCEGRQRMVVVVLMHWRLSSRSGLCTMVPTLAGSAYLAHHLSSSCARVITGDLALQGLLLCSAMSSEVKNRATVWIQRHGFTRAHRP